MTIYAGDRAPKAYQLDLVGEAGVDFTQVTGWALQVRRPDGTRTTWSAETTGTVAASAVSLLHVMAADGTDAPTAGAYDVYADMTLPNAGELQSDPVTLFVQDPFGVRV